jgi:hypothetical protein
MTFTFSMPTMSWWGRVSPWQLPSRDINSPRTHKQQPCTWRTERETLTKNYNCIYKQVFFPRIKYVPFQKNIYNCIIDYIYTMCPCCWTCWFLHLLYISQICFVYACSCLSEEWWGLCHNCFHSPKVDWWVYSCQIALGQHGIHSALGLVLALYIYFIHALKQIITSQTLLQPLSEINIPMAFSTMSSIDWVHSK